MVTLGAGPDTEGACVAVQAANHDMRLVKCEGRRNFTVTKSEGKMDGSRLVINAPSCSSFDFIFAAVEKREAVSPH